MGDGAVVGRILPVSITVVVGALSWEALASVRVYKAVLGVAGVNRAAVRRHPRLHGVLPVLVLAVAYGITLALRVGLVDPIEDVVDKAVATGYLPHAV